MVYTKLVRSMPAELVDVPFRMECYALSPGRLGLELQEMKKSVSL
jgi:hypothetical protein